MRACPPICRPMRRSAWLRGIVGVGGSQAARDPHRGTKAAWNSRRGAKPAWHSRRGSFLIARVQVPGVRISGRSSDRGSRSSPSTMASNGSSAGSSRRRCCDSARLHSCVLVRWAREVLPGHGRSMDHRLDVRSIMGMVVPSGVISSWRSSVRRFSATCTCPVQCMRCAPRMTAVVPMGVSIHRGA